MQGDPRVAQRVRITCEMPAAARMPGLTAVVPPTAVSLFSAPTAFPNAETIEALMETCQQLFFAIVALVLLSAASSAAQTAGPILCFSDLDSGPRTGNSDTSREQAAGRDGAIVTVWGKNLGSSQGDSRIMVNGAEARVYCWGNATAPANLYVRHRLQMVCFQVRQAARDGLGVICLVVNGRKSNELPFTVRAGCIYFVKTTGSDKAAGDWAGPWRTLPYAVSRIAPGDIVYACDAVSQTQSESYNAAVNLGSDGAPGKPKALVAYPGARCLIGSVTVERGFGHWVSGKGHTADHWTLAKFTVTAGISPFLIGSGYRVVGNQVSAPRGSAAEGAIEGSGNGLFVLGNEISQVGRSGCSKLYHPIYISSARTSSGPRQPLESNREIAWNYIHDNNAPRGINIYSEQSSAAYMTGHRVHDNFIMNQVGDGMLIGQYVIGGNWVYNNVIANAGLGPEPRESDACSHFGVNLDAGHETVAGTVIHFCNNTIYGCGWAGASSPGATGNVHLVGLGRYRLDFSNNIICSTGEPYMSGWSDEKIRAGGGHNLWFGRGAPPAWDVSAVGANPRFVDAAHQDFHLQPGSPAVGAGIDKGVPHRYR
ncbi:MAG: hypothetical protein ABSG68_19800 [Thermoguttaceae bacterium]|jgi:hypothetical protein